jgi:Universal stress protein family
MPTHDYDKRHWKNIYSPEATHIPSTSTDNDNEISLLDSKIRYERILVPHDGSEMSDRALRHAVYLSKISGTEIVILHVIEPTDNILEKEKKI